MQKNLKFIMALVGVAVLGIGTLAFTVGMGTAQALGHLQVVTFLLVCFLVVWEILQLFEEK